MSKKRKKKKKKKKEKERRQIDDLIYCSLNKDSFKCGIQTVSQGFRDGRINW